MCNVREQFRERIIKNRLCFKETDPVLLLVPLRLSFVPFKDHMYVPFDSIPAWAHSAGYTNAIYLRV